ncbi:hypothetical protein HPP92_014744 [Vanilla planifolia]|uniref:Uncharacterized protein n=1 Tax=Vanilla planifolia TaxID=51239 RepID=A0A835UV36_VANPL|nr:hypothetical protein HPP92_015248 [Vanilla planifolia]KAG0475058.1 hypothetical protein HPP92_014744 [Vanilla planifolia]
MVMAESSTKPQGIESEVMLPETKATAENGQEVDTLDKEDNFSGSSAARSVQAEAASRAAEEVEGRNRSGRGGAEVRPNEASFPMRVEKKSLLTNSGSREYIKSMVLQKKKYGGPDDGRPDLMLRRGG